ncbi:MAG: glycosyltransferase [Dysgonomonas sp.]
MRICFVTVGDVAILATMKRATGMAEPLIKSGHEVAIIALNCENNINRFNLECPHIEYLLFEKGGVISEIKQKRKLIRDWSPELVYVCSIGFRNWIHKYNIPRKAISIVEHSELSSSISDNRKKFLSLVLEYLSPMIFDGQLVASRYLEKHYKKGLLNILRNNKPILYSPYAYNPQLMNIKSSFYENLEEKYYGKKVVLYIGGLTLNYGFMDIIRSMEIVYKSRKDIIALIMGSGPDKEIGLEYIKEKQLENCIQLLGYVPETDIASYFKLADAFVSPLFNTIQDKARCPSKLFMYIAFEKPIITCRIGEAIELFGDNGYYYVSGDAEQLAKMITVVVNDSVSKYSIDKSKHTWSYRTQGFLSWIATNFHRK